MWVTSVSCASFVITCIFVSISCFSLPKPETQFIIGLICFMDVLWYAKSICQGITALSGSSLEFTLAKIFIVIEPLAISTQKHYILYSFHRFSQITGRMGIFVKPHCIVFISTMIIVTVYATNLGPIFDLFFRRGASRLLFLLQDYFLDHNHHGGIYLGFLLHFFAYLHLAQYFPGAQSDGEVFIDLTRN